MSEDVPSRPEASGDVLPQPDAEEAADLSVSLLWRTDPPEGWILDAERLKRAARCAYRAGVDLAAQRAMEKPAFEAAIVLEDDAAMQALNRDFRGKDKPTNVLSFPAGPIAGPAHFPERQSLGDIVLSVQTLEREAAALAVSPQDHATHLVVHGVLHLLGFDHESETEAARMETLESQILGRLGIADPYGEPEPRPRVGILG